MALHRVEPVVQDVDVVEDVRVDVVLAGNYRGRGVRHNRNVFPPSERSVFRVVHHRSVRPSRGLGSVVREMRHQRHRERSSQCDRRSEGLADQRHQGCSLKTQEDGTREGRHGWSTSECGGRDEVGDRSG